MEHFDDFVFLDRDEPEEDAADNEDKVDPLQNREEISVEVWVQ